MDWALCAMDRNKMRLSNNLCLPNGNILCPMKIAQDDPTDMAVIIHTGPTGIVNGCIVGDYSLVALPGSKAFQRMWMVVFERHVGTYLFSKISRLKGLSERQKRATVDLGCLIQPTEIGWVISLQENLEHQ
jgi:hypothetical protein